MNRGLASAFDRWCLPAGSPQFEVRDGWLYAGMRPPKDDSVIADRLQRRASLSDNARMEAADRWLTVELPMWRARRRAISGTDVTAAAAGLSAMVEARFADVVIASAMSEWLLAATDLGASTSEALAALHRPSDNDLTEDGDLSLGTDVLAPTAAEAKAAAGSVGTDRSGTGSGGSAPSRASTEPDGDPAATLLARLPSLGDTLPDARRAHQWRKETNTELSCWVGCLRRTALGQARALGFADPTLALFLSTEELTSSAPTRELEACATERRMVHDRWAMTPPPATIGTPPSPPEFPPETPPDVARQVFAIGYLQQQMAPNPGPPQIGVGRLDGIGAAPGEVTGKARVLSGIDDLHQLAEGEIIVCTLTSPGWEPALRIAAGVISDAGGLLSHTAVLAREFAIPAVVGTKMATHVLRTGQLVTLDGCTGTVRWS